MKIRKSEMTFSGVALSMILTLAIFFLMFNWWGYNLQSSGQTMNATYVTLNNTLMEQQDAMDNNTNQIRGAIGNITEPDIGLFAVAINGMRGIKAIFSLFANTIDTYATVINSFIDISGLSQGTKTLIVLAFITAIVLLIVAIFAGASNKISK